MSDVSVRQAGPRSPGPPCSPRASTTSPANGLTKLCHSWKGFLARAVGWSPKWSPLARISSGLGQTHGPPKFLCCLWAVSVPQGAGEKEELRIILRESNPAYGSSPPNHLTIYSGSSLPETHGRRRTNQKEIIPTA